MFPDAGSVRNPLVLKQYHRTINLIKSLGYTVAIAWWGQGSFLHQHNGLWGLYDFGESPDNPVVPYSFNTKDELILWYFQDMGWDINLL